MFFKVRGLRCLRSPMATGGDGVETMTGAPVLRASGMDFQRGMNDLLQTRFELSPKGSQPYAGEIQKSYVSSRLRLADIRFSAHHTRLQAGRPSRRAGHNYLVSYQMEGYATVRQDSRLTDVGPNQIFFIDTTQPFEIMTEEIRTRSVYLDSHFWQAIFPERDLYTATALDCDQGLGRLCAEMIGSIFAMSWEQPEQIMHRMAGCLANLLAVSMVTDRPLASNAGWSRDRTLNRVQEAALRNLSDPDLDCSRIAADVGLSVRQVHSVFGRTGTTLMRWIWDQRLGRVRAELENAALAEKPVSAIAFDWGFNDAAHFGRQFKARFGTTPQRYREAKRGRAQPQPRQN